MDGWLTVSRRRGESIMVGDDVEVKISEIRGNSVRVSACAPNGVSIHRREVFEKIQDKAKDNLK